jgi:hypothetical protein
MGGMNYIVKPLQTLALASAFVVAAATYVQDAKALQGADDYIQKYEIVDSDDGLAIQGGSSNAGIQQDFRTYGQQEDLAAAVADTYLAQHVYGQGDASPSEVYLEELAQTSTLVDTYVPDNQCSANDSLDSLVEDANDVMGDEKTGWTRENTYFVCGVIGLWAAFSGGFMIWAHYDTSEESNSSSRSQSPRSNVSSPTPVRKREEKSSKTPIYERDLLAFLDPVYSRIRTYLSSVFGSSDEESSTETSTPRSTDSTTLTLLGEYSQALQSSTHDVVEPEPDHGYNGTSGRDRRARGVWARFATPTSEQQYATTADPEVAAKRRQARKKKARQRKAKKGY